MRLSETVPLLRVSRPPVGRCIDILAHELRMSMRLGGARSISELNRELIRRREPAPSRI